MSPSTKRRGQSIAGWAPTTSRSQYDEEELEYWLNREVSLIQNLLEEQGEMTRDAIGEALGCKYWGPLRFRQALKAGVGRGALPQPDGKRHGPARAPPAGRTRPGDSPRAGGGASGA